MTVTTDKNKTHHHSNSKHKEPWDSAKVTNIHPRRKCSRHSSSRSRTADSVMSTDSDIRFTRRKLGDSQRCGCAVIAGFLVTLLLAGVCVYFGFTYFKPDTLPERVFRSKFRVINGDVWSSDLADQNSLRFQHKARDYRERINLVIRRSDLRESYEGSEVLALDGSDGGHDLIVHFNLHFDPYRGLVSAGDLVAIFLDEFNSKNSKYFANITLDPASLQINEVSNQQGDVPVTAAAPLGGDEVIHEIIEFKAPLRRCEPLRLPYCKSIGYNVTTYPNMLGHNSVEEVVADVIAFRELVDGECFRQAFDFVCRLMQPPCMEQPPLEPEPGKICREYCQAFRQGCGNRLPEKFKKYFDCERFPESTGSQSCHHRPGCAAELQQNGVSGRLCDGIPDCPDLSDEATCSYCPPNALYCGRGRACVAKSARCDGVMDCPDGADEKDCLSIAPMVSAITNPYPLTPHRPRFYSEGFAVFSEKGGTGKLCAEGLDSNKESTIRRTVAESLCKALGYENVLFSEVRNDSEPDTNYVRVLDPRAQEISFVRTACYKKQALFVSCDKLECGVQSVLSPKHLNSLPKMASPGDWPWHVALFRDETHVCDGTLVSNDWVLTTNSCFQGQPKATWIAVFGAVRLNSFAPWTQRRRIVGMVKSPVEGSTAAMIRLETSVVYSDFVRPICLPEDLSNDKAASLSYQNEDTSQTSANVPHSEQLSGVVAKYPEKRSNKVIENRQYFHSPIRVADSAEERSGGTFSKEYKADFIDEGEQIPRAEAQFRNYPIPISTQPETSNFYDNRQLHTSVTNTLPKQTDKTASQTEWINCNTLGWSRQRDHLQRVQLKIGDMAACENVSIATVNSMCTEAAYHKQDCTEEEFAGSPVICMLPQGNRWALIGIASWRIACAQSGLERPRMYDKITSNSVWIRDTMQSSVN
ncbi:hypothetical protein HA402_003588 [Bradysia odoriphaga]|nr:hypothetical protein HA402_003588 [Bradysia odoriphaga]